MVEKFRQRSEPCAECGDLVDLSKGHKFDPLSERVFHKECGD